jgi:uncharacterized DUF497 family protein
VHVTFDPAKDGVNVRKHGISLDRAGDFDFAAALYIVDDREDYRETRYRAIGFLDGRLYSLVFTQEGEGIRAIILRAASGREMRDYGEAY